MKNIFRLFSKPNSLNHIATTDSILSNTKSKPALLALLLVILLNCNQATLVDVRSQAEKPVDTNRTYSYLMGYYEFGETNEAICPNGKLTRVEIKRNFLDSVIHILAGGIATSRTQEIYCE